MTEKAIKKLKYPIGPFMYVDRLSQEEIKCSKKQLVFFS